LDNLSGEEWGETEKTFIFNLLKSREIGTLLVWITWIEMERNGEKLISLITFIFNLLKSGEIRREKKPIF